MNQFLSQQVPSDPLVKLLNDTFGPLGWEYDGSVLKVMAKVTDGHFLSVARYGGNLFFAAKMFGLEVKDGTPKETPVQTSTVVGTTSDRVEPSGGEPQPTVPTGTYKPSRKVINELISECSKIIIAKKLRTQEQLVSMVQAFAVKRKEELTEDQALKLLDQLQEILK